MLPTNISKDTDINGAGYSDSLRTLDEAIIKSPIGNRFKRLMDELHTYEELEKIISSCNPEKDSIFDIQYKDLSKEEKESKPGRFLPSELYAEMIKLQLQFRKQPIERWISEVRGSFQMFANRNPTEGGMPNYNIRLDKKLVKELEEKRPFYDVSDVELMFRVGHFIATKNDVYYYHKGVYRKGGEKIIEQFCQMLNADCSSHDVSEMIARIQRTCYLNDTELDPEIEWLNTKNCMVNLLTGDARQHDTKFLSTIQIPVTYDPLASCTEIEKFLKSILPDEIGRNTILDVFAYCLWRAMPIQKAVILVGEGSNGKGATTRLLQSFLGKSNVTAVSPHSLDPSVNRFASAQLYRKLANICGDLSDKPFKETNEFKKLTGGDTIHAEWKGKDGFDFISFAKSIICTNHVPYTFDDSDGYMRRWVIVEYLQKFEGKNIDPYLDEKLATETELSGLLNLLIPRMPRILQSGIETREKTTDEIRRKYMANADPVGLYFEQEIVTTDKAEDVVPVETAYADFEDYCKRNDIIKVSKEKFGRLMKRKGVKKKQVGAERQYCYLGITLKGVELVSRPTS